MSYKVIRDASNSLVCFGPNDDNYSPIVQAGHSLIVENEVPKQTSQEQRDAIQAQIDALERQQLLPRLSRDIYLALMLKEAAAAGYTEPQLYSANIGYARLKDFDAAISLLRAQKDAII